MIFLIFEEFDIGTKGDPIRAEIDSGKANVEKCLARKTDADFVWMIEGLSERADGDWMWGEYFNGPTELDKRLSCHWRSHTDSDDVWIYLNIYRTEGDADLQWPFDKRVTILICNEDSENVRKALNPCWISSPSNNDYLSAPFKFSYIDLSKAGLLLGNHMTVKCRIHA